VVQGIHTSIPLHQKIFADREFRAGKIDTKFMERFFEREGHKKDASSQDHFSPTEPIRTGGKLHG
jgi:acetyl/propionyl-CoA carboxylase alpha subunit